MDRTLREFVRRRASAQCEYCHLPESGHTERFSVDHVVARKHGGDESAENLALSCLRCNLHKGTNLSGIDPVTSVVVELFNPRRDIWSEHFTWNGALLMGVSGIGRATVNVLNVNASERTRLRQSLIEEGVLRIGT